MFSRKPLNRRPLLVQWVLGSFLFAGIPAPVTAAGNDLPELGAASGSLMTPAQEQRLGQAFMRSIRASEKIIDDPLMADYIQHLGEKLVDKSDEPGKSFTFFLLDNSQINAFAGPGGHIGVFTGLVLASQSESELAAVLAHEISHVTQKHLMRAFYNASQMSGPAAAVLLAAVVLGATVGGDAGIAAAMGGQAAIQQQSINFTRSNEQEADRVGMGILAESEFDPRAMPLFFERMGRANRAYSSELPEFLRTHPVTNSRIADSMGRAETYPYRHPKESLDYQLLRTTLKERSFREPDEAIRYFRGNLDEGRFVSEQAERYGLALALKRAHQPKAALAEADRLLRDAPEENAFLVLHSLLLEETGQPAKALDALTLQLDLYPASYAVAMHLADMYERNAAPDKAVTLLQEWIKLRPDDAFVYQRLARASGEAGNKAEAHAYNAEYHYRMGSLEAATQQLEIALRQPGLDFYESSRLEARLEEIRGELDELKGGGKRGSRKDDR